MGHIWLEILGIIKQPAGAVAGETAWWCGENIGSGAIRPEGNGTPSVPPLPTPTLTLPSLLSTFPSLPSRSLLCKLGSEQKSAGGVKWDAADIVGDPGFSSVKPMRGWLPPPFFTEFRGGFPTLFHCRAPLTRAESTLVLGAYNTPPQEDRSLAPFLPYSVPAETEASGSFHSRKPGQADQHSMPSLWCCARRARWDA